MRAGPSQSGGTTPTPHWARNENEVGSLSLSFKIPFHGSPLKKKRAHRHLFGFREASRFSRSRRAGGQRLILSHDIHPAFDEESPPSRTGFAPAGQTASHEGCVVLRSSRIPHASGHDRVQRRHTYFGHTSGQRTLAGLRGLGRSSRVRERRSWSVRDLPRGALVQRARRPRRRDTSVRRVEGPRLLEREHVCRERTRRRARSLRLRAPRLRDAPLHEPRGLHAHHGHGVPVNERDPYARAGRGGRPVAEPKHRFPPARPRYLRWPPRAAWSVRPLGKGA